LSAAGWLPCRRGPGPGPGWHLIAALGRAAILLVALALPGVPILPPPAVTSAQTGYELVTRASYALQPEERRIAVVVEATFTNRTPNPAGGFSIFETVPITIHDAATEVQVSDEDGPLQVSVRRQETEGAESNVATIRLRSAVRYQRSAAFRLAYRLPDGGDAGLRVRPSAVRFVAWGFGTRSEVAIDLPAGYQARSDGDPLTVAGEGPATQLRSGPIESPVEWAAVVIATRANADHVTRDESVPLAGATVEVRVRAWEDDPEWGDATLDLVVRALPLLESRLGPYPDTGPLVVSQAAPSRSIGFGEEESAAGDEVRVAFDQPRFTVLHQLAHRWVTPDLAADRWIREGLASHVAGVVAPALEVEPPYDPAERSEALAEAAFPLAAWPDGASADEEAYGYAASWMLMDRLAEEIGPEELAGVLSRAAAAVPPYEPASAERDTSSDPAVRPVALDARLFLDHLETLAGRDLTALYAPLVFGDGESETLSARADARAAYRDLLRSAGEWGPPSGVVRALEAWDFSEAGAAIEEASAWLEERDALLVAIDASGLSTPERLRATWEQDGGGRASRLELEATRTVVETYAGAKERATAPRSLVAQVGLLGGDPTELLHRASGLFAESDLTGAMEAIGEVVQMMDGAETIGWVRILSALTVFLLGAALTVAVVRRRRYTRAA
jgi:hypothetical protein